MKQYRGNDVLLPLICNFDTREREERVTSRYDRLPPVKLSPLSIGQKTGLVPEPVWTLGV
jgi:hypothetical protein